MILDGAMQQLAAVSELVTDASDVMKMDQGAIMQTVMASLSLKDIGHALVDQIAALTKPRVRVTLNIESGPSIVETDRRVLHRALEHLMRNAAQATPEGGRITLRISHTESSSKKRRVCFEVHDTGCGIPISRKTGGGDGFQRYTLGSTSPELTPAPKESPSGVVEGAAETVQRAAIESSLAFSAPKTTGLGIGLSLAYGLVRALGSELRYTSEAGNTRFWFELSGAGVGTSPTESDTYVAHGSGVIGPPLAGWAKSSRLSRRSSSSRKAEAEPSWGSFKSTTTSSSNNSFSSSSPSSPSSSGFVEPPVYEKMVQASCVAGTGLKALEAPHVLVVEDTEMCAIVLQMLLQKLGCSSDHAENGEVALQMLSQAQPGLYSMILMDLRMPVMDGFEATRIIKETYFLETVVALTADDSFDVREKCEAIGFDDFATKPLNWEGLASLLEKHTGHVVKPVVGAVMAPQEEGKQGGQKPYDANYHHHPAETPAELPASAGA